MPRSGNQRGHRTHGHGGHDSHASHGNHVHHGFEPLGARNRERFFAHGDLKLVVLKLLQSAPSHGYEIIKAIAELAGGDYSPSPGVIYPTLTLLEDLGQVRVIQEQNGKRQYGITPEGAAYLYTERDVLRRILARIESAGSIASARRAPQLQRAVQNFKTALHFRLSRGSLGPPELQRIAEAIDRAAVDIERS